MLTIYEDKNGMLCAKDAPDVLYQYQLQGSYKYIHSDWISCKINKCIDLEQGKQIPINNIPIPEWVMSAIDYLDGMHLDKPTTLAQIAYTETSLELEIRKVGDKIKLILHGEVELL